jgi:hypothetical protein
MRVEGATWAQVSANFPGEYSTAESCGDMLAREHKPDWEAAYELARSLYLNECEAEAVLTQRSLMRSYRNITKPDGTTELQAIEASLNQSAAHSLLNHTRQLRAQKVELSGPGGGAIPLGVVLDASGIDNGRPDAPDADKAGTPN